MPTYEYRCPGGHTFDKFFPRITRQATAKCPRCGRRARRLISGGAGLVFKGSGFYITDYKQAGDRKRSEAAGDKSGAKAEPKATDAKSGKPKSDHGPTKPSGDK